MNRDSGLHDSPNQSRQQPVDFPRAIDDEGEEPLSEEDNDPEPPQPEQIAMAQNFSAQQLNTIPIFSGESEDVEIWLANVQALKEAFEWSAAATVRMVQNKLTGVAATWLAGQRSIGTTFTWDEFKIALLGRFKVQVTRVAAANAMSDLKQGSKERCGDFYDKVILALSKKNSEVLPATKTTAEWQAQLQRDIYTFFGAGLQRYIRDATIGSAQPPADAVALLQAAQIVEKSRGYEMHVNEMTKVVEKEKTPPTSVEALTKDMEALKLQFRRTQPQLRSQPRRGGSVNRASRCWKCGRMGHYIRDCWAAAPQNIPGRRSGSGSRRPWSYQSGGRGRGRRGFPQPNNIQALNYFPDNHENGENETFWSEN